MDRNISRFLFFLYILFTLFSYHYALADSCMGKKCHVEMGVKEFLHGPVAAKECTVCHVKGKKHRPPKKHDLSMAREGRALCLDCHEAFASQLEGKNLHDPVSEGECTVCHDPHEADNKFFLSDTFVPNLCFACHEDNMISKKFVHSPVAEGDCIVCHEPHGSKHKFLLVTDRITLCFNCHEDRKAEFKKKFVHQPVKESCENCHNPHGSQFVYHLNDNRSHLCWDCHKEFVQKLNSSESKHTAISKNGCLGCHQPHSSDYSKGLKAEKKELCLTCHEDMKTKIQTSRFLHGPVVEGDCTACHDPHATNYAKHLVKFFPDEFYFPYRIENYAMCFGCHNKEIATKEFTDTLTDFRNGKLNLHFLHVNREKGRSCKACHEIHAGNQEKHIAEGVPYGRSNWMLPIKFTKTKTGGTCVAGCHKEKPYDRITPVKYEEKY